MSEKILFLFSLYLPFQIALNPSASVDLASARVLIILLFLFWLSSGLLKKNLTLPVDRGSVLLYSFIFLAAFSLFFAENFSWGARKLLFLLSIFPLYFLFYNAGKKNRTLKLFRGLTYGSFAVSIVAILQFFSQFVFGIEKVYAFWGHYITPLFLGNAFSSAVLEHPSWLVNIGGKTVFRAISVFPDPHMLAFYLGMTAPLALIIHFSSKKKTSFFLIAFIAIFVATLLTFSRGGYLGIFVASVFVFTHLLRNVRLNPHFLIRALLGVLLLLSSLYAIEPLRTRFFASFDFQEGSNRGRIELWTKAVQTISEQPFGVGIGNLSLAFVPTASYRDPIYAHSLYLDIAVELGIPALLVFLALLFTSFQNILRLSRTSPAFLGLLASLSFFATYSLVETPLYSVHVLSLLLILLSFSNSHEFSKNY